MNMIMIGCDPEGFIVDGRGDFIPANGIIPGDKSNPHRVERGAVQVDGVALEFNIDPVDTAELFHLNVSTVVLQLEEMIKNVDKDLSIKWTPVATFRADVWAKVPEQNKVLGCDPDYNVKGQVNINPTEKLVGSTLRTAAGHMHIGFCDPFDGFMGTDHFNDCLYLAKGFYLGNVPWYKAATKKEAERLEYYGHNGSFRPKAYGIELRAPSNRWVRSEEGHKEIFNQTRNKFRELVGL